MAKETITTPAGSGENRILPKGEGARILKAFQDLIKSKGPLPTFPDAACISIKDLRKYLDEAEQVILKSGASIPEDQRGVAIIPAYRGGKITFALVATRFKEDRTTLKVTYINNPVTGILGNPPSGSTPQTLMKSTSDAPGDGEGDDPPIDDYTFDTVGTKP